MELRKYAPVRRDIWECEKFTSCSMNASITFFAISSAIDDDGWFDWNPSEIYRLCNNPINGSLKDFSIAMNELWDKGILDCYPERNGTHKGRIAEPYRVPASKLKEDSWDV